MYEGMGCACFRTAGSHSVADLIVLHPVSGIKVIQAKLCKSETDAKRMITRFKKKPFLPQSKHYAQFFMVKVPRVGLFMGEVPTIK